MDPGCNVIPAVAAQAAAGKAQATKQKNKIMEEQKPSIFMPDEAWEAEKRRRCEEVDVKFAAAGGGAAAAEQVLDPLGPLYTMLVEEMAVLEQHHVKARDKPAVGSALRPAI